METQNKYKPACPRCESGFVYFRIDGTMICRQCGAVIKPEVKE